MKMEKPYINLKIYVKRCQFLDEKGKHLFDGKYYQRVIYVFMRSGVNRGRYPFVNRKQEQYLLDPCCAFVN